MKALGTFGENLAAGLGDADRMFELGRERPVAGHGGPPILQHLHMPGLPTLIIGSMVKNMPGRSSRTGAGAAGVDDLRTHRGTPGLPHGRRSPHHAAAVRLSQALDAGAEIAACACCRARACSMPKNQALVGDVDQACAGLDQLVADQVHVGW